MGRFRRNNTHPRSVEFRLDCYRHSLPYPSISRSPIMCDAHISLFRFEKRPYRGGAQPFSGCAIDESAHGRMRMMQESIPEQLRYTSENHGQPKTFSPPFPRNLWSRLKVAFGPLNVTFKDGVGRCTYGAFNEFQRQTTCIGTCQNSRPDPPAPNSVDSC